MMEYFLVKGTVFVTQYMGKTTNFEDIRLVKAHHWSEAQEKFEKYWENQTSEYSVYYRADGIEVLETIE